MKIGHYVVMLLLVIGLLYVYHNFVQKPGGVKGALSGLGINR